MSGLGFVFYVFGSVSSSRLVAGATETPEPQTNEKRIAKNQERTFAPNDLLRRHDIRDTSKVYASSHLPMLASAAVLSGLIQFRRLDFEIPG